MKKIILCILACFILCSCSTKATKNDVIEKINSVIEISIVEKDDGEVITKGTAFCYDKQLFMTAKHLIENYDEDRDIIVGETIEGTKITLEIFSKSESTDLAILEANDDICTSLVFSNDKPNWLDIVFFIGNSRGLGLNIYECSISNPDKQMELNNVVFHVTQVNGTVNEGDSGAPLLNIYGEVIGVISFKLTTNSGNTVSNMSFAISLQSIKEFLQI